MPRTTRIFIALVAINLFPLPLRAEPADLAATNLTKLEMYQFSTKSNQGILEKRMENADKSRQLRLRFVPQLWVFSRGWKEIKPEEWAAKKWPETFGLNAVLYASNTQFTVTGAGIRAQDKAVAKIMTYRDLKEPGVTKPNLRWEKTSVIELKCSDGYNGAPGSCNGDTQDHIDSYAYDHSGYTDRPSLRTYVQAVAVAINDQYLIVPGTSEGHDFPFDLELKARFAEDFGKLLGVTLK
jgi:hypothetical protein